jgi:hypothetical protein
MSRSYSPSQRQIEANRNNASKSTGPRSEEGKAQSRAKALKHDLTAEIILLPGGDRGSVEQLHEALHLHYSPATDWEEQLIGQAVSLMNRLKRVPKFDAALFNWIRQQHSKNDRDSAMPCGIALPNIYGAGVEVEMDNSVTDLQIGLTLAALLSQNLLSKLNRYEMTLHGRLSATLRELDNLKAHRLRGNARINAIALFYAGRASKGQSA